MAIAIVQDGHVDPAVGASIVIPLAGQTQGNVAIVAANYGLFGSPRTVSAPDGNWTKLLTASTTNNAMDIWWRVIGASPPSSYTFTVSEGSEFCSGLIWEISGCDTSDPFDQSGSGTSGSGTTLTMPNLTPSVIPTLPLSAQTQDNNQAATTTASSGWTITETAASASGRGGNLANRAQTTDTTTAIGGTWTLQNSTESVCINMLIQEPQGGATGRVRRSQMSTLGAA